MIKCEHRLSKQSHSLCKKFNATVSERACVSCQKDPSSFGRRFEGMIMHATHKEFSCSGCQWHRFDCKRKLHYCLLLTRSIDVLKYLHDGGKCPKPQIEETPSPMNDVVPIKNPKVFLTRNKEHLPIEGQFKGQTCFLVAGGPSIADKGYEYYNWQLSRPGIVSMSINNIGNYIRTNFWIANDPPCRFSQSIWQDPSICKLVPYGNRNSRLWSNETKEFSVKKVSDCPNVVHFQGKTDEKFRPELWFNGKCLYLGHKMHTGPRSTFLLALHALYHLGFSNVYIVGADFGMTKENPYAFKEDRPQSLCGAINRAFTKVNRILAESQPYFQKFGFNVFNCTEKSNLTAFPKANFEEAILRTVIKPQESVYGYYAKKVKLVENDPHVTVVMNTDGKYPTCIEEAVHSVLQQDYKNTKLLIVNTHPEGLKLDKNYQNVEIHNIKPFDHFPKQILYAVSQVKTPYWCIVDSDDIVTKEHVSNLVGSLNLAKKKYKSTDWSRPHKIQGTFGMRTISNKPLTSAMAKRYGLWWGYLFSKLSSEQIGSLTEKVKTHTGEKGFDGVVASSFPVSLTPRDREQKWTYVYRLGVAGHVSKPYVRIKQESTGLPVLVPHWNRDYQKDIDKWVSDRGAKPSMLLNQQELLFMMKTVKRIKVKSVVEFGSGDTTVLFEGMGCKVRSYETNAEYAEIVKTRVETSDIILWDGKEAEIPKSELVFIDGPVGNEARKYSYFLAASAAPKFIMAHDTVRDNVHVSEFLKDYFVTSQCGSSKRGLTLFQRKGA